VLAVRISTMHIPWDTLDSETLTRLLTEIVTRDGTDYGMHETSTETKVNAALKSLQNGSAQLFWDTESETSALIPIEQISGEEQRQARLRRDAGIKERDEQ